MRRYMPGTPNFHEAPTRYQWRTNRHASDRNPAGVASPIHRSIPTAMSSEDVDVRQRLLGGHFAARRLRYPADIGHGFRHSLLPQTTRYPVIRLKKPLEHIGRSDRCLRMSPSSSCTTSPRGYPLCPQNNQGLLHSRYTSVIVGSSLGDQVIFPYPQSEFSVRGQGVRNGVSRRARQRAS